MRTSARRVEICGWQQSITYSEHRGHQIPTSVKQQYKEGMLAVASGGVCVVEIHLWDQGTLSGALVGSVDGLCQNSISP